MNKLKYLVIFSFVILAWTKANALEINTRTSGGVPIPYHTDDAPPPTIESTQYKVDEDGVFYIDKQRQRVDVPTTGTPARNNSCWTFDFSLVLPYTFGNPFYEGAFTKARLNLLAIDSDLNFLPVTVSARVTNAAGQLFSNRVLGIYDSAPSMDLPVWDGKNGILNVAASGHYNLELSAYTPTCGTRTLNIRNRMVFYRDGDEVNYAIKNVNSGNSLDVQLNGTSGGTVDGANVQQWLYGGGANQQWIFRSIGSPMNRYQIISENSAKCLDLFGGSPLDGTNIMQFTCHNGLNQLWDFVPIGNTFELRNAQTGKCAEVQNWYGHEGANIQQGTCTGLPTQANQRWIGTPNPIQ